MRPQRETSFTEDEYLALEKASTTKHEFIDGQILAMAGGTPEHSLVTMNIGAALVARLRGTDCFVLNSDARIHVPATGLYTYPDVSVVFGKVEKHPRDGMSVLNPRLIIEVLSDSTENHDRGLKVVHYRSIATLDTYLCISTREPLAYLHERQSAGAWLEREIRPPASGIELRHLRCTIPFEEIYANLELSR